MIGPRRIRPRRVRLRVMAAVAALGLGLAATSPAGAGAAGTVPHPPATAPPPPAATPLPLRAPGARGPLTDERLSNETTVTRWAHPAVRGWVRSGPSPRAHAIVRLHWLTEDGEPEVYLALQAELAADGRTWIRIALPRRPNGTTGWVTLGELGPLHLVRTLIIVDRASERLTVERAGRVVMRAPVGVGAPATPTPAGRFWVREVLSNLRGDPLYGPWALGTSAYSRLTDWPGGGVIGIHGTDEPQLIPGRPSHGCVRLRNFDIERLVKLVQIGTPVWIR